MRNIAASFFALPWYYQIGLGFLFYLALQVVVGGFLGMAIYWVVFIWMFIAYRPSSKDP